MPKMKQWIGEAQGFVLVPVKLGQLMRLFAANGETNASLELARSLLGFTADSGDPEKKVPRDGNRVLGLIFGTTSRFYAALSRRGREGWVRSALAAS